MGYIVHRVASLFLEGYELRYFDGDEGLGAAVRHFVAAEPLKGSGYEATCLACGMILGGVPWTETSNPSRQYGDAVCNAECEQDFMTRHGEAVKDYVTDAGMAFSASQRPVIGAARVARRQAVEQVAVQHVAAGANADRLKELEAELAKKNMEIAKLKGAK